MTNVYLGGALGQAIGPTWRLSVSSPADAIRAINANTRGALTRYLSKEGRDGQYQIALDRPDQVLDHTELANPSGDLDIHILPVAQGANSGVGKIIAGVGLIALTLLAPEIGLPVLVGNGAVLGGAIGTVALGIGTSLILGGISQLLAPSRQTQDGLLNSNSFQGSITAAGQGIPVPVVYGTALVSPIPISIWFTAIDYNTTQNAYVGSLQAESLPGGGMQYISVDSSAVVND